MDASWRPFFTFEDIKMQYPNARRQSAVDLPTPKNQPDNIYRDFFTYVARVSALAPASSQSVNITIDSDAAFTLVKICMFANVADNDEPHPLVRVSIQDTGSGRNLQSAPIPVYSYAGTGQLPFILPIPKLFSANTTVRFTFDNYSSAVTYANVELALQGYKNFPMGS
jgi:hypothetical protein